MLPQTRKVPNSSISSVPSVHNIMHSVCNGVIRPLNQDLDFMLTSQKIGAMVIGSDNVVLIST